MTKLFSKPLKKNEKELIQEELRQSHTLKDKGKRHAAVSLVFAPKDGEYHFLIFKRTFRDDDPWSGHFSLPGGVREKEDKNSLSTAIRETKEEMGFLLQNQDHIGGLDQFFIRTKNQVLDFSIAPYVFLLDEVPKLKTDPVEVDTAYWVPCSDLFDLENLSHEPLLQKYPDLKLPCFRSGEVFIWGITYVILRNFHQKLFQAFDREWSDLWPAYQDYP